MLIDDLKFAQVKRDAERQYKDLGSVYCPYLKESVAFNAKGLEHLRFKGRGRARSREDQYVRLRSIQLAPRILSVSHTLQGISQKAEFISVKTKSQRTSFAKSVTYYEVVAVIGTARVRIIVRSPEGEQKYFWSIIPFWKMDKITGKRLLHNGNPHED